MKRSMNINIFLKQFKASNEKIIQWISEADVENLGPEKLRGLIKILPEPDEVRHVIIKREAVMVIILYVQQLSNVPFL